MTRQFDDVYVISGPAFLPNSTSEDQKKFFLKYPCRRRLWWGKGHRYLWLILIYEVIGENNVAVPTHMFKVILVTPKEKSDKTTKPTHLLGAFLVPNERIPDNKVLTDFEVPLDYLEKHTGMIINDQIYFLF